MSRLPSILILLLAALLLGAGARPAWAGGTEDVQVVLATSMSSTVPMATGARGALLYRNGENRPFLEVDRSVRMEARFRRGRVELIVDGTVHAADRFVIEPRDGSPVQVGRTPYLGRLDVSATPTRGSVRIVNHVPLERYVAAVVASEYGLNDVHGAMAMAVVARTYALASMEAGTPLMDDERSQVYRGEERITEAALEAARATAGQVLTFDGALIEAVYSSSNGGHTASNSSVWDTPELPYLTARTDPFDAVSPHANWSFDVDKDALHRTLSRAFDVDVRGVSIVDTAVDGRVRRVRLEGRDGTVISGTRFRSAVAAAYGASAARSTFFRIREQGGSYRLEGHGFGHGVGMSQYGAHGRAISGQSYQDILAFYYPGAHLETLSPAAGPDRSIDLPVLAAAGSRSEAPSPVISDGSATPEAASSKKVEARQNRPHRVLDAHAAWGRTSAKPAPETSPARPATDSTRVGW